MENYASPIKTWTFIITLLGTIVVITTGWVRINERVGNSEVRITTLETQYQRTDAKLDKIIDKLENISVDLAHKQDIPPYLIKP